MSRYRLGLYEKSMPNGLPLGEKLRNAGAAGFDFMELSIDETDEKLARLEWSREQRRQFCEAQWEAGVPVRTMCLSGHRRFPLGSEDPAARRRSLEIMAGAVGLAADVGIRIIQLAGYDEYYRESNETTKRLFYESLAKCVELAAARGVILAFETMETPFMNTVEKAAAAVRRVDSPYLQVYPDLGNVTNAAVSAGESAESDIRAGKGRLAAMHLKETLPGKFREIPYGTGHVDFERGIRAAAKLGVRLFVGEFWYTGGGGWEQQLSFANRFLREKLDRVFGKEE